jgi:hypothetical protein
MSKKTLGQVAFEAYNESKGGLTYDGKLIPPWHELSGDRAAVHRAWEAAAVAVIADRFEGYTGSDDDRASLGELASDWRNSR